MLKRSSLPSSRLLRLPLSSAWLCPKEHLPATPAIGPLSSTQLDYSDAAVTATLVLAGPRPAAESAHNKTLQLNCLSVYPSVCS